MVDGASRADDAGGENLIGHAAHQADEVRVVDVQINGRPAGFGGVADLRGPIGLGDDALEMRRQQFAMIPTPNRLGGKREFRKERQHMRHHQ